MEDYSLKKTMRMLVKNAFVIAAASIVFAAAGAVISLISIPKEYKAETTLITCKESALLFYEDRYTQSDINMYEQILNTYMEISQSNLVAQKLSEASGRYSQAQIKDMTDSYSVKDTLILHLTVNSENADDSVSLANLYADTFISICKDTLPVADITIIDKASIQSQQSELIYFKYAGIGLLIGMTLSILYASIREISSADKIKTPEQLEKIFNVKVISVI